MLESQAPPVYCLFVVKSCGEDVIWFAIEDNNVVGGVGVTGSVGAAIEYLGKLVTTGAVTVIEDGLLIEGILD